MSDNFKLKTTEIHGGTRSGIDRRQFTYTAHIPERRSGGDRRKGLDQINAITEIRRYDRRKNQTYSDL